MLNELKGKTSNQPHQYKKERWVYKFPEKIMYKKYALIYENGYKIIKTSFASKEHLYYGNNRQEDNKVVEFKDVIAFEDIEQLIVKKKEFEKKINWCKVFDNIPNSTSNLY